MTETEVQKTTPSNVMQVLSFFEYGGCKVIIRKWYNCYEYLLVHHGQLFCDYVQYGKVKGESNQVDTQGIINHLRSAAIDTIEYHNKERSIANQINKYLTNLYEKARNYAFAGNKRSQ